MVGPNDVSSVVERLRQSQVFFAHLAAGERSASRRRISDLDDQPE